MVVNCKVLLAIFPLSCFARGVVEKEHLKHKQPWQKKPSQLWFRFGCLSSLPLYSKLRCCCCCRRKNGKMRKRCDKRMVLFVSLEVIFPSKRSMESWEHVNFSRPTYCLAFVVKRRWVWTSRLSGKGERNPLSLWNTVAVVVNGRTFSQCCIIGFHFLNGILGMG